MTWRNLDPPSLTQYPPRMSDALPLTTPSVRSSVRLAYSFIPRSTSSRVAPVFIQHVARTKLADALIRTITPSVGPRYAQRTEASQAIKGVREFFIFHTFFTSLSNIFLSLRVLDTPKP